jgi:hypothetical protein
MNRRDSIDGREAAAGSSIDRTAMKPRMEALTMKSGIPTIDIGIKSSARANIAEACT